jgi:prepilin-type N-terminal cleavage/methylation domain-containing protein
MSSHRNAVDRRRSGGFVLIEVLVAVAVAAVIMAVLLRSFSTTWSGITSVRDEAESMLVARTLLATAAPRAGLAPGTLNGTLGRYAWTITTTKPPVAAPVTGKDDSGEKPAASPWALYRLDVVITTPNGRSTSFEAYRISQAKS